MLDQKIDKIVKSTNLRSEIKIVIAFIDENLIEKFTSVLSNEEMARANRFVRKEDSNQFIFTRGLLKNLLGKYSGLKAEKVLIEYGENGKPFFENRKDIFFNVSHSKNVSIFAFTSCGQVGVDVEAKKKIKNLEAMARQAFSTREIEAIKKADEKLDLFFNIWTKKEACIKAMGCGFLLNAKRIEVPLNDEFSNALIDEAKSDWFVKNIDCFENCFAAVAIEKKTINISKTIW